jgi:hypothetical protein
MYQVNGKVIPGHATKAYRNSRSIAPPILNLDTRWRWVASFTPRKLHPRKIITGTHWIGGWVGPRAGLDAIGNQTPIPIQQTTLHQSLFLCLKQICHSFMLFELWIKGNVIQLNAWPCLTQLYMRRRTELGSKGRVLSSNAVCANKKGINFYDEIK